MRRDKTIRNESKVFSKVALVIAAWLLRPGSAWRGLGQSGHPPLGSAPEGLLHGGSRLVLGRTATAPSAALIASAEPDYESNARNIPMCY